MILCILLCSIVTMVISRCTSKCKIKNLSRNKKYGSSLFRFAWGLSTFIRTKSCTGTSKLWIFFLIKIKISKLEIWVWPKCSWPMILRKQLLERLFICRLSFVSKNLTMKRAISGQWDACFMSFALFGTHFRQLIRQAWFWRSSEESNYFLYKV